MAAAVILPAVALYQYAAHKKDKIGYQYAYQDKLNILQNTKGDGRLILVGGSNLAFGINSQMLEDSLHMPVVNMGLHAGVGLRFEVESVKEYLQPGDILLIVPEYDNFTGDFWLGEDYLSSVVATDYNRFAKYLTMEQDYTCGKNYFHVAFMNVWSDYTGNLDPNYYRRTYFEKHGDYIGHLEKTNETPIVVKGFDTISLNEKVLQNLYDWQTELQSDKHVSVAVGFPAILDEGYKAKKPFIDLLVKKLIKTGIPIIGIPENYTFPRSYIFDKEYHLTKKGRDMRTQQLMHDIQERHSKTAMLSFGGVHP